MRTGYKNQRPDGISRIHRDNWIERASRIVQSDRAICGGRPSPPNRPAVLNAFVLWLACLVARAQVVAGDRGCPLRDDVRVCKSVILRRRSSPQCERKISFLAVNGDVVSLA